MMKIWLPKLNYYSKRLSRWHEKLWEELTGKPYMGIIDNVAGVRFYKEAYGTIGAKQHLFRIKPEPYSPQGPTKHFTSVSAFPYGTTAAAGVVSGLTTQLDRGRLQWDTTPDTAADPCYAYGYSITGEHYLSFGSMGTIDSDTYNDGGGTSRTIKALYQTDNCGTTNDDTWYFALDGTSISNSDTTWQDLDWDNTAGTPVTTDRSADTTYTASLNGSTHWRDTTPNGSWLDQDINTDVVITTA
jgi:hypothetical protein